VKTYMQTHGAQIARQAGAGPWGEAVAFASTGAKLVKANGAGALFVGIVPRLMQQVGAGGPAGLGRGPGRGAERAQST
jgi:hypothetical protein